VVASFAVSWDLSTRIVIRPRRSDVLVCVTLVGIVRIHVRCRSVERRQACASRRCGSTPISASSCCYRQTWCCSSIMCVYSSVVRLRVVGPWSCGACVRRWESEGRPRTSSCCLHTAFGHTETCNLRRDSHGCCCNHRIRSASVGQSPRAKPRGMAAAVVHARLLRTCVCWAEHCHVIAAAIDIGWAGCCVNLQGCHGVGSRSNCSVGSSECSAGQYKAFHGSDVGDPTCSRCAVDFGWSWQRSRESVGFQLHSNR
jgi:hypothetical protein